MIGATLSPAIAVEKHNDARHPRRQCANESHLYRSEPRKPVENEAAEFSKERGITVQFIGRDPHDPFIIIELVAEDAMLIFAVEKAEIGQLARKIQ
ncbi:MAG: hypothetical protein BWY76_01976 [bacterium ADurb.Bin429]|nr:MAG: hypothetical protein BWY76_01976 [bacterium ADurb.Bin429]